MGGCKGLDVSVTLRPSKKRGVESSRSTKIGTGGNYKFEGVLPGIYDVMVQGESMCWKASSVQVTVSRRYDSEGFCLLFL